VPGSLAFLLPDVVIDVVDIGANPIDGDPPYASLLAGARARVVGFEPNDRALRALLNRKGPFETYLPYAIGDGQMHKLNLCMASGMSSLLTPNMKLLNYFHGFDRWAKVLETLEIQTKRLDDVGEISNIDLLKIDIQGYELEVFRNALEKLRDCLVIQTEVEFLPMYENQPLFSDVEMFLRSQGFLFHKFDPLVSRTLRPIMVNDDICGGLSQLVWGDAIFVRVFTKFSELSPEKLARLTVILHEIYKSWDVAFQALSVRDTQLGTDLAARYYGLLR
jgi:FkbM family methyltransferase